MIILLVIIELIILTCWRAFATRAKQLMQCCNGKRYKRAPAWVKYKTKVNLIILMLLHNYK